jgi:hypothetical protein
MERIAEEVAQQRAELAELRARVATSHRRRLPLPRNRFARVLIVAAFTLSLPMTALAAHQFTDVGNNHTFHTDIDRVADAGITAGCGPTTYCPDASVTRGQMAAFLSRTGSRAARSTAAVDLTSIETALSLTSLTIRAGNISGGTGFLMVTGSVQALGNEDTCPCTLGVRLLVDGSAAGNNFINTTITNTASPVFIIPVRYGNAANTWVFPVSTGANHTVTLQAYWQPVAAANGANLRGNLTAVFVPFGSQGGNVLGATDTDLTEVELQQLGE